MPFSYGTSVPSRSRRGKEKEREKEKEKEKEKDKDTRSGISSTSSGSSKTHRRPSRSSDRSPPRSPLAVVPSLYTQQNLTLDKLPALPESGATSPSSVSSRLYPRSPTSSHFSIPGEFSESPLLRSIPPQPTVEDDISEAELTTPRVEHSAKELETLIVSRPKSEVLQSSNSPVLHKVEPTETRPSATRSASLLASLQEVANKTQPPLESPSSPTPSQRQPAAASPYSAPLQPSPHLYRTDLDLRAGSPPSQNYPPNQFFSPPTTAGYYYPMAYHSSLPPHMQGFPPPAPSGFAGFGTPQLPFATMPLQSPPLQRQGSLGSKTGSIGDTLDVHPPPPLSTSSAETALIAAAGGGANTEDDAGELLHRIQSAIPDLHQLLNRYRETSGQLGVREELIRKTEAQQADALKQKEYYIDSLGKQLEITAHKHSAESSKLRLEIGNLEEKTRELADSLAASEKSKKELEEAKRVLEGEKATLEKRLTEERELLEREFESWKVASNKDFETQRSKLVDDFERRRKEQEENFQSLSAEMSNRFLKEKESMRNAWSRQKRDLEINYDKIRRDLEGRLSSRLKDLEVARDQERESREAWAREREALVKSWDEERTGMGKGWEEQRQVLIRQHMNEMEDMRQKLKQSHDESTKEASAARLALEKENEMLRKGWNADKEKFNKIVGDLKAVTDSLDTEKCRLQKMVETFGEATDLRSKGDTYFIDAFSQLRRQIVQLSEEHFQNLPIAPPNDVLARVPPGLPSFLANTDASRRIRQAYVQHVVSSVLTYRIFHPFLFTLGRRYDGADILFQDMSRKLRYKSIRKECVWRQHTLHAAYSVSSAKQSINKVATVIIDEIVNQIKHFADPKYLERIMTAVRRIVKIAAETWRYARLERELITARMPAAEDTEEPIDEWYEIDDHNQPGSGGTPSRQGEPRRVILRLLPIICREPTHEELRDDSKVDDNGCLYSHGVALFSNSPAVVARVEELHQRGLDQSLSPGSTEAVEPQQSATQLSKVPSSVQRTETVPTSTRPTSPRPNVQEDIQQKNEAAPPDRKDIAQAAETTTPQKDIVQPQRNRSPDSTRTSRGPDSERTPSGSSQETFSDRRSSDAKIEKYDPIPKWGSSGGQIPGGW